MLTQFFQCNDMFTFKSLIFLCVDYQNSLFIFILWHIISSFVFTQLFTFPLSILFYILHICYNIFIYFTLCSLKYGWKWGCNAGLFYSLKWVYLVTISMFFRFYLIFLDFTLVQCYFPTGLLDFFFTSSLFFLF